MKKHHRHGEKEKKHTGKRKTVGEKSLKKEIAGRKFQNGTITYFEKGFVIVRPGTAFVHRGANLLSNGTVVVHVLDIVAQLVVEVLRIATSGKSLRQRVGRQVRVTHEHGGAGHAVEVLLEHVEVSALVVTANQTRSAAVEEDRSCPFVVVECNPQDEVLGPAGVDSPVLDGDRVAHVGDFAQRYYARR